MVVKALGKFLHLNYKKILILILLCIILMILDIIFSSNNPTFILSSYIDFPISIIAFIFSKICFGILDNSACFNLLYPIKIILNLLSIFWRYILVCAIFWFLPRLRSKNKNN